MSCPTTYRSYTAGLYFQIVHKWTPCHREALKRSHVDKTIVLLKIGDRFVPIVESAVQIVVDSNKEEAANSGSLTASSEAAGSSQPPLPLPPPLPASLPPTLPLPPTSSSSEV